MTKRGNGEAFKELTPDQALDAVERELSKVLSADARMESSATRDRVVAAVFRYGRACARKERELVFQELDQARKTTALQEAR
jgi:hypothetical protein